jgi:hypothetical protein
VLKCRHLYFLLDGHGKIETLGEMSVSQSLIFFFLLPVLTDPIRLGPDFIEYTFKLIFSTSVLEKSLGLNFNEL